MPGILSGQTQHIRAYGKRRTNVISRRAELGQWEASPNSTRNPPSSNSGSSSEDDLPPPPRKVVQKKVEAAPVKMTQREEVQIVVPVRTARPSLAAAASKKLQRSAYDKENVSTFPKQAATKKAAAKKVVTVTDDSEEEEKAAKRTPAKAMRAPLAARAQPSARKPPVVQKTYGGKKVARPFRREESAEESEEVVLPPPRARKCDVMRSSARKRPVVVTSEDAEDALEESEEIETVEPSSSRLADEAASSSCETDEHEIVVVSPPPPSRKAPSVRSRSSASTVTPVRSSRLSHTSSLSTLTPLSSPSLSFSSSSSLPPRPSPTPSSLPLPSSLKPLLPHLLLPSALSFSSLLLTSPSPLAYFEDEEARPEWRKIGEASYSEVFETMGEEGGEVVVKIIPINTEGEQGTGEEEEMPYMSEPEAVRREIEVSKLLGGEGEGEGLNGFVRFKGAFLVQGAYPSELLASWDSFKASQSPPCDDQIRPDVLPSTQYYALLLLENAGQDLETYKLKNWREAASVLGQVMETLGQAEEGCGFEHRDLHWGNILLSPTSPSSPTLPSLTPTLNKRFSTLAISSSSYPSHPPARLSNGSSASASSVGRVDLSPEASGVKATLIDFTLSRVEKGKSGKGKGKEVLFDAFEDECVFEGEGDHQFDVYRSMRALVEQEGGGWKAAHLKTNVLWLHYLAFKLLHARKLKPPTALHASSCSSSAYASYAPPSSPFRSSTSSRRFSALPSSTTTTFTASSPARRARTLPSAPSRSRQPAAPQLSRRELEMEHRAYELLEEVGKELEGVIAKWGLGGKKGKGGKPAKTTAAGRGRRKTVVVLNEDEEGERSDFGSAKEVGEWWRRQVEGEE
ncbi:hypothetical protein JCM8547_007490 [Rhodosporidiobolus lusitaniae]